MKVRPDHLVAATAIGFVLALSNQTGQAQQVDRPTPDAQAVIVPVPEGTTTTQDPATPESGPSATASIPEKNSDNTTPTKDTESADANATGSDEATTVATTPATEQANETVTDTATPAAEADSEPTNDVATPAVDEPTKDVAAPTAESNDEPAKDVAAPAIEPKDEPAKDTATPASETQSQPTMDAAAPDAATTQEVGVTDVPSVPESAVATQLRQLIEDRLDRYVSRKDDRVGVKAYYETHGYKPLWVTDSGATDRARAAIAYLQQVETVGLDSRDYPTPDFRSDATPESLAADELKLTNSVLTYARHAEIGRIHYSRVAADILFDLNPPDPAQVLAKLATEQDAAATLDSYNPPQPGFKALKAKLAEARNGLTTKDKEEAKEPHVRVPHGRILRPGMRDKRVALLRQRLEVAGDRGNTLYDEDVIEAVKAFQTQADLYVDGMVGPNTLAALNGEETHAPADPVDTILVNMERWRWLPRKLGNSTGTYVVVNVPDFTTTLMHNGKPFWKSKVVVGKPANMTPMVSAEMKFITVNPTWNVPPSIVENEYLPALEQDPTVLDRYGLQISQDRNGFVRIWQPPGPGNALGRLRFNFPNKFLVYQHDTPDKHLFKRVKRAYSHGCIRVQDPVEYAEKLLSIELPEEGYSKRKIQSMYGNNEININFPKPIPVHLTYQTAFVDEDGSLQFRVDVYRRDARMIQILKGREMKVADTAISHPPDTSAQPVRMPVGMYSSYEDGYYMRYDAPGLFDWLFGAPVEPQRYRRINRPRGFIGPRNNNAYSRR